MTEIETLVLDYLQKFPESSGKQVAKGLKQTDSPTPIVTALNSLLTLEKVEREFRNREWFYSATGAVIPVEKTAEATEIEFLSAENVRVNRELEFTRNEIAVHLSAIKTLKIELAAKKAIPDAPIAVLKKPTQPRRPYTITGLSGYHAQAGKVTLFVDRRLNARSITLHADKLQQLAELAQG